MKLHLKSVDSKTIQENSCGLIQSVLPYAEYELYSQDYVFTIKIRVNKGEKTLNKLKEIFNQDVEVEIPDAII